MTARSHYTGTLLLSLLLLLCAFSALAEGNCPRGYYPIGGKGVQGCAPIPSGTRAPAQSGYSYSGPIYSETANSHLEDSWGALAFSASSGTLGDAVNEYSKELAEQAALERCAAKGATDCKLMAHYANSCIAVAVATAPAGLNLSAIGMDDHRPNAEREAAQNCIKGGAKKCRMFYNNCVTPKVVPN